MPKSSLLSRIGLDRPELRAWAMYDWAASAMQTTIMVAVFPIYFVKVAGAGLSGSAATQRLAVVNTLALVVIALLSPILGAISDYRGNKKPLLGAFLIMGASAVAAMFFIRRGDLNLASGLFLMALIGGAGSFVFYEALLPHLAHRDEIDRVSTAGYAMGYIGGGVLLALNLMWIQHPDWFGLPSGPNLSESEATLPVRLAFVSVAIWWVLFSTPLLRRVPEPPPLLEPDERPGESPIKVAFVRLAETFRELRGYRQAFLMLVAFMIYNDGIQTIIKMATAYGTEIGIGQNALIGAILLVQFVGIPCSFLFGILATRIGAKHAIFLGLVAYAVISVLGILHEERHPLLPAGGARGYGPGRNAGAEPLSVCKHDTAAQIGRVLRLLQYLREIRRDFRAAHLCRHDCRDRLEPECDPVGHRILCGGRGAALER